MLLMPHRKESSASTIFTGKQSKIASGGYRPLLHTRGERPSCCCSADELNELTSRMPSLEGTWSGGLKAPDCACSMRTKIVNATPKIPRGTIIGRQTWSQIGVPIWEPFLFWSVIGFYQRRTQLPSLVPKAELLPSISPGKASIGASLNSLFKGICFGG